MLKLSSKSIFAPAKEYHRRHHWKLMRSEPILRKIKRGRRMKTVGHRVLPLSEEYRRYYDHLNATQASLAQQDHGWVIVPSIRSRALDWCQGVDLVAPVEIRCEDDLRLLRDITERHLRGDLNTLNGYSAYAFADWQADQPAILQQTRLAAT